MSCMGAYSQGEQSRLGSGREYGSMFGGGRLAGMKGNREPELMEKNMGGGFPGGPNFPGGRKRLLLNPPQGRWGQGLS